MKISGPEGGFYRFSELSYMAYFNARKIHSYFDVPDPVLISSPIFSLEHQPSGKALACGLARWPDHT